MCRFEGNTWIHFIAKATSLVLIVCALYCFNSWANAANAADAEVQKQIEAAERAANRGPFSVADGTYEGTSRGYGGDIVIAVAIENGYITSLEALSHENEDPDWWDLAQSLLSDIPSAQNLDIDIVSGATYSSVGIINATKAAIVSAPAVE